MRQLPPIPGRPTREGRGGKRGGYDYDFDDQDSYNGNNQIALSKSLDEKRFKEVATRIS